MNQRDAERVLAMSGLLDQLTRDDPDASGQIAVLSYLVAAMVAACRGDKEDLMSEFERNTRATVAEMLRKGLFGVARAPE